MKSVATIGAGIVFLALLLIKWPESLIAIHLFVEYIRVTRSLFKQTPVLV